MSLFPNKHVYTLHLQIRTMHIYAFFLPIQPEVVATQNQIMKARPQLLPICGSLQKCFPPRRICNTKSQGSYWVRRLGKFLVHWTWLRTTKKWHFLTGWFLLQYRYAYVLVVTFGNQVLCRSRNSAALSYPHLFGWFYSKESPQQKKTWSFFKWGWTSLHFTPLSQRLWRGNPRTFDGNRCDLASSCQHMVTRPFVWVMGFIPWFTHLGVSINSWIGKINS